MLRDEKMHVLEYICLVLLMQKDTEKITFEK